jgi:hypothetical protein
MSDERAPEATRSNRMELGRWLRVEWDRAAAVGCVVVAALMLLIGWFRMSGTPYPAEQLPFILSGGIGGVFLIGIGATLWLSADLRDEWRKLDRLEEEIRQARIASANGAAPAADVRAAEGREPNRARAAAGRP